MAAGAQQADQLAASADHRVDAGGRRRAGRSGHRHHRRYRSRPRPQPRRFRGQTGRGSGGGQPTLNFDTDAPRISCAATTSEAPQAALASPTAAEVPTAPAATGGSQPLMPLADLAPTAVARTDAGGLSPSSGGPAQSIEIGPPTEVSVARSAAEPALARAELSQAVPDPAAAGGGTSDEEEEERKRRLAHTAAQAMALATPTTAEGINAQAEAAGDASRGRLAALFVGRASARRGCQRFLRAGSRQPAPAKRRRPPDLRRSVGRAVVPPDVPTGPAMLAAAGAAVARTARGPATPSTSLQAALAGMPAGARSPHPGNNWPPPRPPESLAPKPDNRSPLTPQPAWLPTSASRRRLPPRALLERNQVPTARRPRPGRRCRKWPGPVVRARCAAARSRRGPARRCLPAARRAAVAQPASRPTRQRPHWLEPNPASLLRPAETPVMYRQVWRPKLPACSRRPASVARLPPRPRPAQPRQAAVSPTWPRMPKSRRPWPGAAAVTPAQGCAGRLDSHNGGRRTGQRVARGRRPCRCAGHGRTAPIRWQPALSDWPAAATGREPGSGP